MRSWDKSKSPRGPWVLNKDSIQAQNLLVWHPLNMGASAGWNQADYSDSQSHATAGSGLVGTTLDKYGSPAIITNGTSDYFEEPAGKVAFLKTSQFCVLLAGTQKFTFGNWNRGTSPGWEVGEHYTGGKASIILSSADGANFYGAEEAVSSSTGMHDYFFVHDGSLAVGSRTSLYRDGASVSVTQQTFGTADPGTLVDSGMSFARTRGTPANYRSSTISDLRIYTGVGNAALVALSISDPATRFELFYPLRSKKWISIAAAPAFIASSYQVRQAIQRAANW